MKSRVRLSAILARLRSTIGAHYGSQTTRNRPMAREALDFQKVAGAAAESPSLSANTIDFFGNLGYSSAS